MTKLEDFKGLEFDGESFMWDPERYPTWMKHRDFPFLKQVYDYQQSSDDDILEHNLSSDFKIYKMDKDNEFYNIVDFTIKKMKDGSYKADSSRTFVRNREIVEKVRENRNNNYSKLLQPFMHGFDTTITTADELVPLWDADATKEIIFNTPSGVLKMKGTPIALHHILNIDNFSYHKKNKSKNPGDYVKMDLTKPTSGLIEEKHNIVDELLSTVAITTDRHNTFHRTELLKNSGIEVYLIQNRPWALRNADNYNLFYDYIEREFKYRKIHTFEERIEYLSYDPNKRY